MIDVCGRNLVLCLIIIVSITTGSAGFTASLPRMRPYTGIGLVVFSPSVTANHDVNIALYEEPGLLPVGTLDFNSLPGNEWIRGLPEGSTALIVSARNGDWLRVFYDHAGREAWIGLLNSSRLQTWEQFMKLGVAHMLPGLQQQYYQLQQQPGGISISTLVPAQLFKVLKLENSWGLVLTESNKIGWLRWRDDDGRLTVGVQHK